MRLLTRSDFDGLVCGLWFDHHRSEQKRLEVGLDIPVELNRRLNEAVEELLRINREKMYAENASCQEGGQVPAA